MRYFPLHDFQYMVLAFFIGLICVLLTYMAWGSYPRTRKERSKEELIERGGHEIETGHHVDKNPISPFLIYIYIFISLWSLCYMLYAALTPIQIGY
jgi:hypothetical protein